MIPYQLNLGAKAKKLAQRSPSPHFLRNQTIPIKQKTMKLPTMKLPAMKFTLFSPPAASVVEPSPTDLNSAAPAKRTSKIFSFNEKGAPTEQEKSLCADVSLVDGVDQVIANKSDTEACDLLRGMILNLSNEVDDCCGRLAQKESQLRFSKKKMPPTVKKLATSSFLSYWLFKRQRVTQSR